MPLRTFFPKLSVRHIEVDICDKCNFSCKNCIRLAPYFKENHYSYEEFEKDVRKLATVIRCDDFTLLGGEPLLNDRIMDYVTLLREVKICNKVFIFTNGSLLSEKHIDLIANVDEVAICVYPNADAERIRKFVDNCPHKNKVFAWPKDEFFLSYTEDRLDGCANFAKCDWKNRCHIIYKGHYFRCGAASKYKYLLSKHGIEEDFDSDGCSLHEDGLYARLKAYIHSRTPLKTCNYCLQADPVPVKHEQIKVEKIL